LNTRERTSSGCKPHESQEVPFNSDLSFIALENCILWGDALSDALWHNLTIAAWRGPIGLMARNVLPEGFLKVWHCGFFHRSCALPLATIRLLIGQGHPSDDPPNDVLGSADVTIHLRQDTSAVPVCPDLGRGHAESLQPDPAPARPCDARSRPSSAGPHGTQDEKPPRADPGQAPYVGSPRSTSRRSSSRDCGESVRRWARVQCRQKPFGVFGGPQEMRCL
jgi:hypothetical protein